MIQFTCIKSDERRITMTLGEFIELIKLIFKTIMAIFSKDDTADEDNA